MDTRLLEACASRGALGSPFGSITWNTSKALEESNARMTPEMPLEGARA